LIAVHPVDHADARQSVGLQRPLDHRDHRAVGSWPQRRPRNHVRVQRTTVEHEVDTIGDERGEPADPVLGEVHAVVLEPLRAIPRERGPVGDLEITAEGVCFLVQEEVVVLIAVDVRPLLRVLVAHVVVAEGEPDDVRDRLAPGLGDHGVDGVVEEVAGVVVAAHHHDDLAQLTFQTLHRGDGVVGPEVLPAPAGLLDGAAARLGVEHEVVTAQVTEVGPPPHARQRRVADEADVGGVLAGLVDDDGAVGGDAIGRARGDGDEASHGEARTESAGYEHGR
jgi:hypothetical protein